MKVSKSLRDVWRWKEEVYQDTKDMTNAEVIAYYAEACRRLERKYGIRLKLQRCNRRGTVAARHKPLGKEDAVVRSKRYGRVGVVSDPKILGGAPVIRGTRVPVQVVVGSLAGGMNVEEVCDEYELKPEQVRAALAYAAELLADERVHALARSLRERVRPSR